MAGHQQGHDAYGQYNDQDYYQDSYHEGYSDQHYQEGQHEGHYDGQQAGGYDQGGYYDEGYDQGGYNDQQQYYDDQYYDEHGQNHPYGNQQHGGGHDDYDNFSDFDQSGQDGQYGYGGGYRTNSQAYTDDGRSSSASTRLHGMDFGQLPATVQRSKEPYPAWTVDVPLSKEEIEDIFMDLTAKFGFQRDSMRNMYDPS